VARYRGRHEKTFTSALGPLRLERAFKDYGLEKCFKKVQMRVGVTNLTLVLRMIPSQDTCVCSKTPPPAGLAELAAEIAELEPMRRGSVNERAMKCGKPGCRCSEVPKARHGP
jgi:hypothetical protein